MPQRGHSGRLVRPIQSIALVLIVALFGVACLPPPVPTPARTGLIRPPAPPFVAPEETVRLLPERLPFPFEANVGQAGSGVEYLLRAGNLQAGFGAGGVTYRLTGRDPSEVTADQLPACTQTAGRRGTASPNDGARTDALCPPVRTYQVNLELVGAQPVSPIGTVPAETVVTYLVGKAEAGDHSVPAFHQLAYVGAWPEVDVLYERSARGIKSSYTVAPGADPSAIRLAWNGATDAHVDEHGDLVLRTPLGELRESAPISWQEQPGTGRREPVVTRWLPAEAGPDGEPTWGFALSAYDPTRPLIIDPDMVYGTYVGGAGNSDQFYALAVDRDGVAYVGGSTSSPAFNFGGAPGFDQTINSLIDGLVVKLAANGQSLIYATLLGGNDDDDVNALTVDEHGRVYAAGITDSTDFGFGGSPGFHQATHGSSDAFVVKLAANGQSLMYGTYLGGSGPDTATGIAVDDNGAAYVSGGTASNDMGFGSAPGFDQSFNGGNDGFVMKLAANGQSLIYATYLGGSDPDVAIDIAVDDSGIAYVAGHTGSSNFEFGGAPGFDQSYNGGYIDAFVVKLATNGQSLVYGTYLGGSDFDAGDGIAVDDSGRVYVAGNTYSNDFGFGGSPGFDQSYNGNGDAFVVVLAAPGQSVIFGTYLGGQDLDGAGSIAVNSGGIYVAGATSSSNFGFGGAPGFDQSFNGGNSSNDAFVVRLAANGQSLLYGTFLGGADMDVASALAVDEDGHIYITGSTSSSDFGFGGAPGFDQSFNGAFADGFVVKLESGPTRTPTPIATSSPTPGGAASGSVTPTATSTPTPFASTPKDEKEDKPKETEDQRRQRERTNRSGRDEYATEGNVTAVDAAADPPTITIANRDGVVVLVWVGPQNEFPTVKTGDYIQVDGVKVNEQRYEVTDISAD